MTLRRLRDLQFMSPVEIWSQPRLGLSQVYLKATLGFIFNFLFFWSKPIDKQLKTCLTSRRRNKEEEGKGWKQKQDLKAIVELKQNEEKTRLGLLQKKYHCSPFICLLIARESEKEEEITKGQQQKFSSFVQVKIFFNPIVAYLVLLLLLLRVADLLVPVPAVVSTVVMLALTSKCDQISSAGRTSSSEHDD